MARTSLGLIGITLVASLASGCSGDGARGSLRDGGSSARLRGTSSEVASSDADVLHARPAPGAFAAPGSRARLRHTITLGESHGEGALRPPRDAEPPSAPMPAPTPQPIYVVPTYGYGYAYGPNGEPVYYGPGTYGWRDVDARPREPAKPSPSRPPALGQDWAKPPSYGPTFPFKTAPADPWK